MPDFNNISLDSLELLPIESDHEMISTNTVRTVDSAAIAETDDTYSLAPVDSDNRSNGRKDRCVKPKFTYK